MAYPREKEPVPILEDIIAVRGEELADNSKKLLIEGKPEVQS